MMIVNYYAGYADNHALHHRGWIYPQEIAALGDPETDTEKLLQAKKTKKPTRIAEVQRGYLHASRLAGVDGQSLIEEVFGGGKKKANSKR